jgi:hypothetical protein
LGVVLSVAGWIGFVAGPSGLAAGGAIGFLLGVALRDTPGPRRQSARADAIAVVVLVAVATLFLVSWGAGSPELPILQERSFYALRSQRVVTPVSRMRYIIVGIAFATAWYGSALFLNMRHLRRSLSSDVPPNNGFAEH